MKSFEYEVIRRATHPDDLLANDESLLGVKNELIKEPPLEGNGI